MTKNSKVKKFIPYITAGDPDFLVTEKLIGALKNSGADMIELGVPYSDPIGDGPVNIRASERALKNHVSLVAVLDFIKLLRKKGEELPLVLFTYFNPVLQFGLEKFARMAKDSGVSAVLVVDLPPEEASEYLECLKLVDLGTVFLASPTTTDERLKKIDESSSFFVYYVSRSGVTGTQSELSETLGAEIAKVKTIVKKPLMVGFGISTPGQAKTVSGWADGVVVGSAIVKLIEQNLTDQIQMLKTVGDFASNLNKAIKA